MKTIPKKTCSFKETGDLNGYGLRRAIEALTNDCLPRPARVVLSQCCSVAASTSAFKITMARSKMAELCGVTSATIRRRFKDSVSATIITETAVFDRKAGGFGQMPTEYQFTKPFLQAAKAFCKAWDTGTREVKALAQKAFNEAIKNLQNKPLTSDTPRSKLTATPDQDDHQILGFTEYENPKDYAAPPADFDRPKAKSWDDARAERATTQAQDHKARQEAARAKRQQSTSKLKGLARWAFNGSRATGRATPQTSHNAARMRESDQRHEQTTKDAAQAHREALASGYSPLDAIRRVMPGYRPTTTSKDHHDTYRGVNQPTQAKGAF